MCRCERLLNKLEDCPKSNTGTPHLDATSGTITVGVLVNVVIDLGKWNEGFGGRDDGRAAVEEVQHYLTETFEDAGHGASCTGAANLVIVHVPKPKDD